jgi:hypothetical protein
MNQIDGFIVCQNNSDSGTVSVINRMKGDKPYTVPMRQVFSPPPHFTADNHFSGDHEMNHVGSKGYGITCTTHRDWLPTHLKKYLHHEKKDSMDARMKVMRYENPISAIKYVAEMTSTKVFTKALPLKTQNRNYFI